MKLAPEQKAFFEFGAARAFLFNKIEEARNYARRVYGESYCELTRKERADCWKQSEIKFFIKLVRERRAACRAWTIPGYERNCNNCHHVETLICNKPCIECFRSSCELNCEMDNDYWEPRKEGMI